jgi:hypothetical protein
MSVRQGLVCKLQREEDAFWFVTILFKKPFSWVDESCP